MSSRKHALVIAPQAKKDIRNIFQYSVENWGVKQAELYRDCLMEALHSIRSHPDIGRKRTDVGAHCRSCVMGSHIIFYKVSEKRCRILRILHQKMDVLKHLS